MREEVRRGDERVRRRRDDGEVEAEDVGGFFRARYRRAAGEGLVDDAGGRDKEPGQPGARAVEA